MIAVLWPTDLSSYTRQREGVECWYTMSGTIEEYTHIRDDSLCVAIFCDWVFLTHYDPWVSRHFSERLPIRTPGHSPTLAHALKKL